MKKFLSALLAGAMILSLAACGNSNAPAPSESTPAEAPQEAASVEYSVGMITDVGGVNDQSFNQSAWEGLQALKAETGIQVSYRESEQEANYKPNIDNMVDSNVDLIWGIGFMMGDSILEASNTNPDQMFAIVDNAYETTPSNLIAVVFRAEEPSFLVGYMAGCTTQTDKVGYVGGIKSPTIDQFEFGYLAGVQYAAKELGKDIEVMVQYADSFSDDAKGKAIATSMFTSGADIVFHAAGNVGQGVIEAAKDMGKLAIGVDRDQSDLAPENVMTSALKLVGSAMKDVSKRVQSGENLGGQTLSYGIKEDAAGVPAYTGSTANLVDEAVYNATLELQEKIKAGEINVPNNEADYESFVAGL